MTQQPNTPAPVEKAAPSAGEWSDKRVATLLAQRDAPPKDGAALHAWAMQLVRDVAAQQAAQPVAGEPVMVEAVAEVVDTDDGLTLRWLIEGGIAAMADGCVLVMPHSPITGDDGSGEVYTAAPAPVGLVPLTEQIPTREALIAALQFYADREHMILSDESAWDTVSGEPQNWWCDEAGTATIEDGSIAAMTLAGKVTAEQIKAMDDGDGTWEDSAAHGIKAGKDGAHG